MGHNTKLNDKLISTRNCKSLNKAVFCTTSPFFFQGVNKKIFNQIASKTKYQEHGGVIYGGDCYLFGLLAMGLIDVIVECGLAVYDFMALVPIV